MAKTKDAPGSAAPGQLTSSRDKADKKPDSDHELEGLMSEIESDLREEQLKKFWARYGNAVITLAGLLVLGVAAFQFWQQYQGRQHAAVAAQYTQASNDYNAGKYDAAIAGYKAVAAQRFAGGYKALALFGEAASDLGNKDEKAAIAIYTALAADQKIDPVMRDLATLFRVEHSADDGDAAELEAALAPVAGPNNPFSASALELSAMLAAKQGDYKRAQEFLAQVTTDPSAPADLRERASYLDALFKTKMPPAQAPAVTDLAKPPADVGQAPAAMPAPSSPPPSSSKP